MRVGFNPNKDKELQKSNYYHQVIVPVYIPNQEGYFKDSMQILQYCLESLFKTSHSQTYFTVVNNGSCNVVVDYLNKLHGASKIHEIIHTSSIGKLNAILKGIAGHQFELITITDSDVLFLNAWQKATYEVFEAFPKTGVVSPSPNPKLLRYYTGNSIASNLFNGKVSFTAVQDKEAMIAFANSIDNQTLFNPIHFKKYLTVSTKKVSALIGAGHFVATYKSICFKNLNQQFSVHSLGGDSEKLLLDKPGTDLGMWRLSTSKSYVYHLGNVVEDWMESKFSTIQNDNSTDLKYKFSHKTENAILNKFSMGVFSKIIFRKPFWELYLRIKGLTKEEAHNY